MEEKELVDKILGRDRRALSWVYHTYTPKLRRYIRSRIANHDDAEEVLQDTLFAFLESLRDFQGKATLKTFLFSICQHKIVDFYRRKKIKHLIFSQIPQLDGIVSPLLDPEQELDVTLVKEKIQAVLSRLLPIHREILILKYLDNLSVAEIAHRLAITFKSAESRLFRARKAFVELFLSI